MGAMKTFSPGPERSSARFFAALFIAFAVLITPIMPVMAAPARTTGYLKSNSSSKKALDPATPATTIVTASKTDSFPDPNNDGKAEPGDTITYDVNVNNTGASDATGVTFTDTIDPNTTLVPGSLRISPLAFADSYTATKDTALNIAAPGVLANDTGTPAPTAQPIAAGATAQGGSVTLNADGSFSYTPPSGFTGTDSFNYTATNGLSPDDTATVTINVDEGPAVTTTSPAGGAINVAQNTNITVNFTEPVNASPASFTIECPTGSPQGFTLSASPSASFTLDPTADLPAGTTCTVTVVASQITDADAFDPPDQMAANFVFSFGVKPLAVDDMESATGNVRINSANSGYSVLANDQAPGAIISAFDATSAQGGSVNLNTSTGTFTYNPPRGFEGADSFNYTISNSAGSDQGTVVITVTDMLWFINNAPGACSSGCDGRLSNPYTSLPAFEAANGSGAAGDPEAGDHIFIYTGTSDYTAPLTLENNQRVIGQGATSSIEILAGISLAPSSDGVPSTGGTNPTITSAGNGINLALDNALHGLTVSNTTGTGLSGNGFGTLTVSENVIVSNTTSAGTAIDLSNGILAASFQRISAGNNDGTADPVNGIVLANTTGNFTVTGNTSGQCGGNVNTGTDPFTITAPNTADCSGGEIRNTSGAGIHLTNATNISLTRMWIHNSFRSGIDGAQVNGFTFANGFIEKSGLDNGLNPVDTSAAATNVSNIMFNRAAAGTENLSGSVSITNSTLTNAYFQGIEIFNTAGTISDLTISSNRIASTTSTASSKGVAIRVQANGTPTTAGALTKATISSNSINNFPSDAGIKILGGNNNAGTPPPATLGVPGSGTDIVSITNNAISGASSASPLGTNAIETAMTGRGQAKFSITNNGTVTTPLQHFLGVGIASSGGNFAQVVTIIDGNVIDANDNIAGSRGMSVGSQLGVGQTGSINASITNNIINNAAGNGIFAGVTASNNTGNFIIKNNTVGASRGNSTVGIQVNSGSGTGNTTLCLDLANNNTTGSNGSLGPAPGIGFRKQGTNAAVNVFGIVGLIPSPATAAQAETFLTSQNPGSSLGDPINFSHTGSPVGAFAVSGSNFVNCGSFTVAFAQTEGHEDLAQAQKTVAPSAETIDKAAAPSGSALASGVKPSDNQIVGQSGEVLLSHRSRARAVKVATRALTLAAAPPPAPMPSGETVNVSIGTLPAGKSVHVQFQVTVDSPLPSSITQVSNQGTVAGDNFTSVQTDDPTVGGASDPTVTPILTPPDISINNASAAEPSSGSAPAAFTVVLSHAYSQTVTVNFTTANDTGGANPATAGTDYTVTSGTLTFDPGDTVQTISVPVLADGDNSETDETFLVNLTGSNAGTTITDNQAVGTITTNNTAGTVIISELRTSGPAGLDDDFVEILNNTDSDITVQASDASSGWALVKSGGDCSETPVVIAVIPNGTVIPARGNYLLVGSAYSLAGYAVGDQTLTANIENDRNVALFTTAALSNLQTSTRLDAVGFGANTGNNCDLLREGATLQPAGGSTSEYSFVRKVDKGETLDTNDNAADFQVVSTTPSSPVGSNVAPTLGAPGPENSTGARGPVPCNAPGTEKFGRAMLDSSQGVGASPNLVRDMTSDPLNNSTYGTLDFRRRFTNNTGGSVTRLRFRIVDMTTFPTAPGSADLRARTSAPIVVTGVNDAVTCNGSAPCNVAVEGTILEMPPVQALGGGVNSTLSAGTITLGTPLANGASANLHFLFGLQQEGDYHVGIVIETLTSGGTLGQDIWELRGNTQTGGDTDGDCNTPPVANAGADQTVECAGATTSVTLDGSASSDPDGDTPLTYEWREGVTVLGTGVVLNTSLAFGSHTITLKVTDPFGAFSEDTVVVNVVDTTNPMVTAPPNVTVSTGPGATSCGAFISNATLGTATATDGCAGALTPTRTGVPAGNNFPVGQTIITYTADDGHGHTASATQTVTVIDNTPPNLSVPPNQTVNAPPNSCSANVNPGMATANDNCPGVTVAGVRSDSQPLNAPYPVGVTTITWTATDASNNTTAGVQTITVKDATSPVITLTSGTINLSPPNHSYQTFTIAQLVASVTDQCDASVDINDVVISQVTSDETENGNGDGNTNNDIVITPDCKSVQLRRERSGNGNGRVYKITLKVKDSSGNVATAVRQIFVPKGNGPAIDSGVHYTVNGCAP
jgi:uncharacterized repeat protein (TIGR01451 family)